VHHQPGAASIDKMKNRTQKMQKAKKSIQITHIKRFFSENIKVCKNPVILY